MSTEIFFGIVLGWVTLLASVLLFGLSHGYTLRAF